MILPRKKAAEVARLERRRLKILVVALKTMAKDLGYAHMTQEQRTALKDELEEALTDWRDAQARKPVAVNRHSTRLQRLWNLALRIENRIAAIAELHTHDTAKRLAELTPAAYDRVKRENADALGINVGTLNDLVARYRDENIAAANAASMSAAVPPPWPEAVDGQEVILNIADAVRRHVVMGEDEALATALWIAHCWAIDAFFITPRLLVTSATKRAGKTTLRDVLSHLVPKPIASDNATAASIFRSIDPSSQKANVDLTSLLLGRKHEPEPNNDRGLPTLLLDESDTWVRRDPEIRGIINSGHRRGGYVMRMDGRFSTFAPAMIAMIGPAPDTITDRSIILHLQRRRSDQPRTPFTLWKVDHLTVLTRQLRRWAEDHLAALRAARPDVTLDSDRAEDNWRIILAIADEARLGAKARLAAERLTARAAEDNTDPIENLIVDIHAVLTLGPKIINRVSSADLTKKLVEIEGSPWAEWKGNRPISDKQVAWMLHRELKIESTRVRFGGRVLRGYYASQFGDAFARFARPPTGPTPNIATSLHQQIAPTTQKRGSAAACSDVAMLMRHKDPHHSWSNMQRFVGVGDALKLRTRLTDQIR